MYQLSSDIGLVATVDFFTPILDDPFDFGRVAAANALSDVYAMGGQPIFALNIVGFPRDTLSLDVLGKIIEGGSATSAEAGVVIIGGHSIDDAEPKYGLVVIGRVPPGRIVRNVGALPGDRLFLTKPLGSGIITTAIKREVATPELVSRITELMATLNRDASAAMLAVGPNAATDVTGFGLLGHLWEMVSGSGVGAIIDPEAVPVFPEVRDFARQGVVPGGTRRNLAGLEGKIGWGAGIEDVDRLILTDAQTSGGLLISISADRAEKLRAELVRRGTPVAAEIGRIVEGDNIRVE